MLKLLTAINRYGCWLLMGLMLLFIFTGMAITKNLMDQRVAKWLHEYILPLPFYILLIVHFFFPLRDQLVRRTVFKTERTATAYAYTVSAILLSLCFWLHFR